MNDTTNAGELTITRIHDAPRELIFDCMTTPEHLTHFWGPIGVSAPLDKIKIDLRPGGVFETVMVDDGSGAEYPTTAEYVEVDRPAKLVWVEHGAAEGMTTTITFVDLGDGRTEVTTHQTNVPDMFRTPEAEAGMLSAFDRFDAYLATLRS